MRAVTAVALVVAVVVGAWFTVGPGAGPPVGRCAPATYAPVDRSVPDGFTGGRLTWDADSYTDVAGEIAEEIVLDVVAFDDAFVAVGRRSVGGRTGAFVMRSPDGIDWTGDASANVFPETELSALAVGGERLFALGSTNVGDRGGTRAAVWYSDDGLGWTEATGPFDETSVTTLAGTPGDLVLAGSAASDGELVVWHSTDGASWERVEPTLPMSATEAAFADLAPAADGWLGVGSVSRGPDSAAAAVVWRSVDGLVWTCQVLDPGDLSSARAWELHRSADAWLAIGDGNHGCWAPASCAGFPLAWSTLDGAWTNGYSSGRDGGPVVGGTVYAADELGFVAIRGNRVWTSVDGARWVEVAVDGAGPRPLGQAEAAVLAGGRFAAVGSLSNDLGDDVNGRLVSGQLRR